MEVFSNLALGMNVIFSSPGNLIYLVLGVVVGTFVGALPGIGPAAAIAILLPTTFKLDPVTALIFMSATYLGTTFGGSITSVMLNVPGEAASVWTAVEGYPLAKKGRAGAALGMAAISSGFGAFTSTLALALLAPLIVDLALAFGPTEYFALIFSGLTLVVFLNEGSWVKGAIATFAGILIGTVGLDPMGGYERFTFGSTNLVDGIQFIVIAIGVFAIGEILENVLDALDIKFNIQGLKNLSPTAAEIRGSLKTFIVSPVIGFVVGALPGSGIAVASFLSYAFAKRTSKNPDEYGHGAMEGIVASEASNSAAVAGALAPLLTLGIPGSGSTAIMLGALVMFGLRPGPLLFDQNPSLVWGVIASLLLATIALVIINLPFVPQISRLLSLRYQIMYPLILLFVLTGSYSLRNNVLDVYMSLIFGIIGLLMKKLGFSRPSLMLAVVLGPLAETSLRQALNLSDGSFAVFFTRPISLVLIIISGLAVLLPLIRSMAAGSKK